ncbi:MAG: hypothetical protein ACI9DF_004887, partial [Verrucomicrobiales bacterium]
MPAHGLAKGHEIIVIDQGPHQVRVSRDCRCVRQGLPIGESLLTGRDLVRIWGNAQDRVERFADKRAIIEVSSPSKRHGDLRGSIEHQCTVA